MRCGRSSSTCRASVRYVFAVAPIDNRECAAHASVDVASHDLSGRCGKEELRRFFRIEKCIIHTLRLGGESMRDADGYAFARQSSDTSFLFLGLPALAVFVLEDRIERPQARLPQRPLPLDPRRGVVERPGIEREMMFTPDHVPPHQPGPFEQADVLRDRIERDRKRPRYVRDSSITTRQPPREWRGVSDPRERQAYGRESAPASPYSSLWVNIAES